MSVTRKTTGWRGVSRSGGGVRHGMWVIHTPPFQAHPPKNEIGLLLVYIYIRMYVYITAVYTHTDIMYMYI